MPRKQKRPEVETIRRKCVACGKIKEVKFKDWYIPPAKFVANQQNRPNRIDIPGASVKYYGCFVDNGVYDCGYEAQWATTN